MEDTSAPFIGGQPASCFTNLALLCPPRILCRTTTLELFKDGTVTGKSGFTAGSKHSNYAGQVRLAVRGLLSRDVPHPLFVAARCSTTRSTLQTGTSEGKWEGVTITITEVADSVKGLSTATTKTVCTYAHARVAAAAGVLSSPKPVAADPNCQMRVALT